MKPEYILAKQISRYLQLQYKNVYFRFDMGGVPLSRTQAIMNKAVQKCKGWPDLTIFKPKTAWQLKGKDVSVFERSYPVIYHALMIELKPEGTKLYKKDGSWATPHLAEQAECMRKLEEAGYKCSFGIGFDECRSLIDNYLK